MDWKLLDSHSQNKIKQWIPDWIMSVWTRKSFHCVMLVWLQRVFKLILTRGRISPIKLRVELPQPIKKQFKSINLTTEKLHGDKKNNETDCKLQKAYDEMRDSYLQLKEQYSNLFKENQRLKDAGHTYEGKHDQDPPKSEHSVFAVRVFGLFEPNHPTSEQHIIFLKLSEQSEHFK